MENYISAIESRDLVAAKKAFGAIMAERTSGLIEERKKFIAASVMIEGEEPVEDEDDEDEDKSEKDDDEEDE
ncbi:putative prohead core protein [Klebsiella phage vB_KpnM_BovinicusUrsus]|uniref:Putative prohead core protein n=1 Tax=Klebsiella phage vB_KpnM_BovinicusUrsus TaxID=2777352 RepID=A0A7T3N7F1_9CAUD|nr:putative prohead core protein [Klebsiella phage vB_KpnM_BovinicusUrsus]